jgi:hypothetical protein
MLSCGVAVLPDPPYTRLIELNVLAEQHGFDYGWTYDSHILWQESYATLPLVADRTDSQVRPLRDESGIRDPTSQRAGTRRCTPPRTARHGDGDRPRRLVATSSG